MIQLTEENHHALSEDGYFTVPGVVPEELCNDLVQVIHSFLEIPPEDPAGWYEKKLGRNGIVPVHQHQAVWNTRQHPDVHPKFIS